MATSAAFDAKSLCSSCRYVKRRAREGFTEAQAVTDSAELARVWEQGRQQLEVVRRQSIVYGLYSRRHRHAMVREGGWAVVLPAPSMCV